MIPLTPRIRPIDEPTCPPHRRRFDRPLVLIIALLLALTAIAAPQDRSKTNEAGKSRSLANLGDQNRSQANTGDQENVLAAYRRSFALVIGINGYPGLPPKKQLHYAENDAKEFAEVLENYYGFDHDDIRILLGPKATLSGIREAIQNLANKKEVQSDDRVIIYFSGHGHSIKRPHDEGVEGYIVPQDAKIDLSESDNLGEVGRYCLRMGEIWNSLIDCPARHILFIADSCYSGVIANSVGNRGKEPMMIEKMRSHAVQALTAGEAGQTSQELENLAHGLFTYHLIKTLKEWANEGRTFEVGTLYNTVEPNVKQAPNSNQNPRLFQENSNGSMFFVGSGGGVQRAARVQRVLAAFGRKEYEYAFSNLKELAEGKESSCYYSLAQCYANGLGTKPDEDMAWQWYQKAAEVNDPKALYTLAWHYEEGKNVPQDYKRAFVYYQKAGELGDALSLTNLGYMYEVGRGTEKDFGKAKEYYERGAKLGDATAMNNLGIMYEVGLGISHDYTKALSNYRDAATNGSAAGMANLGDLYFDGHGVDQSYADAFVWYQKGADKGNAYAMNILGILYQYGGGVGIPKDVSKAIDCYTNSFNHGRYRAANYIGDLYSEGIEVEQDYDKAKSWYQKAADKGDALGMYNLGVIYQNGKGTAVNYPAAMEWYGKASDKNNSNAMVSMGLIYEFGANRDNEMALQWYRRAARLGNTRALEILKRLGKTVEDPNLGSRKAGVFGSLRKEAADVGIIMIPCDGGKFVIGDDARNDAKPAHSVWLEPYWLSKTPITYRQFRAFTTLTGYAFDFEKNRPTWGWETDQPMVNVSYNDAEAFCKWAGGQLPTEAEYEAASSGPSGHPTYPWGADWNGNLCWHSNYKKSDAQQAASVNRTDHAFTTSNGLVDLIGNVAEWCLDYYQSGYPDLPETNQPMRNPTGPTTGYRRVIRGASWADFRPEDFTCSFRAGCLPQDRQPVIGFRVAGHAN